MSTKKKPRGKPFQKGRDSRRNLGGRLPTTESPTAYLREKMAEMKGGRSRAERIADALAARAEGSDASARTVLERIDGKVPDTVDLSVAEGGIEGFLKSQGIDVQRLEPGEDRELTCDGFPSDVHLTLRREHDPEDEERIQEHLRSLIMGKPRNGTNGNGDGRNRDGSE